MACWLCMSSRGSSCSCVLGSMPMHALLVQHEEASQTSTGKPVRCWQRREVWHAGDVRVLAVLSLHLPLEGLEGQKGPQMTIVSVYEPAQ